MECDAMARGQGLATLNLTMPYQPALIASYGELRGYDDGLTEELKNGLILCRRRAVVQKQVRFVELHLRRKADKLKLLPFYSHLQQPQKSAPSSFFLAFTALQGQQCSLDCAAV